MEWHEVTDVIVIGSGFAGLAAAIEARTHGASVMVFEKMNAPGGNSIISDGGIAAAGTSMQEARGIQDSPEIMAADMLKAGLNLNQPRLVRMVAEKSNEAFRWSADFLGVTYLDRVDQFGGHSLARCYAAEGKTGATIIRQQVRKLAELGVQIKTRVYFDHFIRDAGRVIGVSVLEGHDYTRPGSGKKKDIRALKGVVLASGGFGADVDFRMAQDHRLDAAVDTTNKPFADAQALREALLLGANPVHLSHIQLGPWTSPDEKGFGCGPAFADYIVFQNGVVVNPVTGLRFVNELGDRKMVADAILYCGQPSVGIADAAAVAASGWDISRCLEKGVVKNFENWQGLADCYGIPGTELENTISRFNKHIVNGRDTDFGKPILDRALDITHPPYYAMRLWPKVHYTMGGIQIDEHARVIDLFQRLVPGFYAAGEVTGGIHGGCRLGSCSITECLVFGRIAGSRAAEDQSI